MNAERAWAWVEGFLFFSFGYQFSSVFFFLDVFVDMIRWVKSLKITYSESNKKCDATGQKIEPVVFFLIGY